MDSFSDLFAPAPAPRRRDQGPEPLWRDRAMGSTAGLCFGPLVDGFAVYLVQSVVARLREGTRQYAPNEAYGRLMGRVFQDQQGLYVVVSGVVYADRLRASPGSFRLSGAEMAELRRSALAKYPTEDEIGWTHSHPSFHPYSSEDDIEQATWPFAHHIGLVTFMRRDDRHPFALVYRGPTAEPVPLAPSTLRGDDFVPAPPRGDPLTARVNVPAPSTPIPLPATVGGPDPAEQPIVAARTIHRRKSAPVRHDPHPVTVSAQPGRGPGPARGSHLLGMAILALLLVGPILLVALTGASPSWPGDAAPGLPLIAALGLALLIFLGAVTLSVPKRTRPVRSARPRLIARLDESDRRQERLEERLTVLEQRLVESIVVTPQPPVNGARRPAGAVI